MSYRFEDLLLSHFSPNGSIIPEKILKYTIEGENDNKLTKREYQETTIAYDLIQGHLHKKSPTPLLIIVSSDRTEDTLKELYHEKIQEFKQLSREMLFSQGRGMGLKVFDIVTKKEFNEIPERIITNCKPVKIAQLIHSHKETQRTIELEPRKDKKFPTSTSTINLEGLSDDEIVQKIAYEAITPNRWRKFSVNLDTLRNMMKSEPKED